MQGKTAQKIFAFDEGDVWRHPGHSTSRSFIPRSSAICVRSFEIVATAHVGRHYAKQDKHNLASTRTEDERGDRSTINLEIGDRPFVKVIYISI